MAIKSRLLSKLKFTYMTTTAAAAAHPQKLRPVLHNLEEARELCRRGLKGNAYAKYGEIFDGLIMAVKQILSGEAGSEAGEVVSLCKDLLQHMVTEIGKEDHFKKEMVFLPYKASMWDSLESVWRAAYEDKDNCLAYVIPIPYCDRNPDGTAKEWHCERDLFPKDVPTLDWQEVDLKAMHPDVIFFHYPYDDCNRVTSVEEIFYSRNIKPCTDKLVYIPYFVLGEPKFDYDDPKKAEEVEEAEEKIAHFILEPGVFNADRTIVQSEAMKKVYVNVLTRHTNADREYWEEHILGLGSPKFDKVAESRKEDFQLPEEWERIIKGRKTILYNTGLTAMLEHTDKYLEKLKSVLETFKAQQDVVLWWRPHPLLISTFESMHPELLDEYLEIVREYRQDGWGLYDDTAELERAVAWTDGYYGDWSSVIQLYQKTGKPIFIQNSTKFLRSNLYKNINSKISFIDIALNGNSAYFFFFYYNALFEVNIKKEQFALKKIFKTTGISDSHAAIAAWNSKIIIAPRCDDKVVIYDVEKDTYEFIIFEFKDNVSEKEFLFNSIEIYGNFAYLIPGRYPGIIKINLITKEMYDINSWYKKHNYLWKRNRRSMIFHTCKKITDKTIMLTCWRSNRIWFYDMEKETMECRKVGVKDKPLHDVEFDNGKIWVSYQDENAAIYLFKDYNGNNKKYWIGGRGSHFEGGFYLHKYKGDLYAVPTYGSHIIKYDNENDCFIRVRELTLKPRVFVNRDKQYFQNFLCVKHINEKISIFDSVYDNQIWWIRWENLNIKKINIVTDEKTSRKLFMSKLESVCQKGYEEDSIINLEDFFAYIKGKNISSNQVVTYAGSCGEMIYGMFV